MRKIFIALFVAVLLVTCVKEDEPVKHFRETDLDCLKLDSLAAFWDEGELFNVKHACGPGIYFEESGSCLDGLGFYNNQKMVWVTVFASSETAIEAMEYRISKVAAHIVEGKGHGFTDKWWIEEGSNDPAIFVNKENTIIELNYLVPPTYEIGDRLYLSALEIANRVDSLSVLKAEE